jgi:hypothetical protein
LKSANTLDEPDVNLNFLADYLDLLVLAEGVCFVDDILTNGDGMKDIIGEDYPWPMSRAPDASMNKMILERSQTESRKYRITLLCNFPQLVTDCSKILAALHASPRVLKVLSMVSSRPTVSRIFA